MIEITKELLDVRICDYCEIVDNTQTLREFITSSEQQFNLPSKDVESLDNEAFNRYLEYLDELWDILEGVYEQE